MATYEKWAKLFKSRHQYLDSVPVQFGNAKDAALTWDGTNLTLKPVADDTGAFVIGDGTTDMDFKVFMNTSSKYVLFDQSGSLVTFVATALTLGADTAGTDLKLFGATTGNYLLWDASEDDLLLTGTATQLAVAGTTTSTNSTSGSLRTAGGLGVAGTANIGGTLGVVGVLTVSNATAASSATAGALIVTGGIATAAGIWVGTTSRLVGNVQMDGTLIVGNDAAGRDFTVYGDVTAYKAWWDANADTNGTWYFGADTKGVDVKAYGATTGNYLHWDASADDLLLVGTATQLAIAGTTASTTTGTGSLRTAGGLGVAGAAYIGGVLDVTLASLNATTGRIAKFTGTVLTPNFGDGYGAIECQLNIGTGAVAGYVATMSSWVNLAAATTYAGGSLVTPLDVGIWGPSGTFTNSKMIMGLKMSYVIDDGTAPGELFLFNTNIFSNATTALFDINTIVDFTATASAAATGAYKLPFLKERSTGTTWYMNIYTS